MQPGDEIQPFVPPYIHNALSRAGLQLKIVPGRRYGLFSTKAFAAGNHIMTEDAAACCVSRNSTKLKPARTNDKSAPIACGYCMCDDKPLMTCTSCGVSRYCSREHQAAHWPRHKFMCARFKKSLADAPKEGAWHQHFTTLAICAELHDCANGKVSTSSAPRPSHADVMFLCTARPSPAAAVLTSALLQTMGDDGPMSKPIPSLLHAHVCAVERSCFTPTSHPGCEYLLRVPRNAFSVMSPAGCPQPPCSNCPPMPLTHRLNRQRRCSSRIPRCGNDKPQVHLPLPAKIAPSRQNHVRPCVMTRPTAAHQLRCNPSWAAACSCARLWT
jgi:hypothetical protein